jgi:hypothetical protein
MTYDSTSFSLTYTVGGETHLLSGYDATSGIDFEYLGDAGWGLPAIERITNRGALQNGDTDIDNRFDARTVTLGFFVECNNPIDHLRYREAISNVFIVSNQRGTLTVTYSSTTAGITTSTSRALDVFVSGGIDFGGMDYQDYNLDFTVKLRSDTGVWRDTTQNVVLISQEIAGTPTPIPLLIPWTLGGAGLNKTTTVNNVGQTAVYPVITIQSGSVGITNLSIINSSTGKQLVFPILNANTTYVIDLGYGKKTIISTSGTNAISLLSASQSNLATWGLVPRQVVLNGANAITCNSSSASTDSSISIAYYTNYLSI